MKTLTLDITDHRGKQALLLKFPYDNELINLVKQLAGATWSRTHDTWYVTYSIQVLHEIKKLFEGFAIIDASILKEKIRSDTRYKRAPAEDMHHKSSPEAGSARPDLQSVRINNITNGTGNILLFGMASNSSWTWTVGGILYMSTSSGTLTQTAPSATNNVIQVIGQAISATTILFKPSIDYITHT